MYMHNPLALKNWQNSNGKHIFMSSKQITMRKMYYIDIDSGNVFWFVTLHPLIKQIKILPFLFCTQYFRQRICFFFVLFVIFYTDINHKYTLQQSTKRDVDLYENKCGTIRSKTEKRREEKKKFFFLIKSFVSCVSMKAKLC